MNLTFNSIYQNYDQIFKQSQIDLSEVRFFDPWGIGFTCLRAVSGKDNYDIVPPKDHNALCYLKRIHFDQFLRGIGFKKSLTALEQVEIPKKRNLNVQEINHCKMRDEFDAHLSHFTLMFTNFGMNIEEAQLATALVGELGNNVFDHNLGNWPTDISGAIIAGQNYPKLNRLEIVVADPGIGFKKSLIVKKPDLQSETQAIELGLQGVSGRIGERRGNGLKLIKDWTLNKFSGILRIQSGDGLVIVDQKEIKRQIVQKMLGTIAEFVIQYK